MRVDALSFYLAKLLGVVLVIIGIALFSKTKHFQDTVKEVSKINNPALLDAFHDVLVDQLYDVLVERGKLEKV